MNRRIEKTRSHPAASCQVPGMTTESDTTETRTSATGTSETGKREAKYHDREELYGMHNFIVLDSVIREHLNLK